MRVTPEEPLPRLDAGTGAFVLAVSAVTSGASVVERVGFEDGRVGANVNTGDGTRDPLRLDVDDGDPGDLLAGAGRRRHRHQRGHRSCEPLAVAGRFVAVIDAIPLVRQSRSNGSP